MGCEGSEKDGIVPRESSSSCSPPAALFRMEFKLCNRAGLQHRSKCTGVARGACISETCVPDCRERTSVGEGFEVLSEALQML